MGGACNTNGGAYRVLVWKPVGKSHLEDLGVDRKMLLKWKFKKLDGACAGLVWLRTGTGGRLL